MRDKLYKTNKKAGWYRARSGLFLAFFLIVGAAAITLPYRYVAEAINAYQEKKESEPPTSISEEMPLTSELV